MSTNTSTFVTVNGWTRYGPHEYRQAADSCGDLAVGPVVEDYYQRTMPDGRVVAVERATYFEFRDFEDVDDPNAEIFMTERIFYHTAPDAQLFEDQWFDVEDYEYENVGYLAHRLVDGEMTEAALAELRRYGGTDDREYLLWEGQPRQR